MSAFADWRERRQRKLEADKAHRRKIAKNTSKPPPPPPPQTENFLRVCRSRLRLRAACELESEEAGQLLVGSLVRVLERTSLPDGSARALVAIAEASDFASLPQTPAGWVTAVDKDSRMPNLLEVTRTHRPSPEVLKWMESLESDEQRLIETAWAYHLSAQQFRVLRMKATDEAHTGALIDHFLAGTYSCAGCGQTLYTASHKFQSTCGWPSFSDSVDGALQRIEGRSVEIVCRACGAHVGHVYRSPFHPPPHHERHCANSTSLRFVPERSVTGACEQGDTLVARAPAAAPAASSAGLASTSTSSSRATGGGGAAEADGLVTLTAAPDSELLSA